jgi:hypothetical protein
MIRNLKTLGLVLLAIFAMSAVAASAASAIVEFHSDSAPVTFTGAQDGGAGVLDTFSVDGGITECETLRYTGTMSAAASATVSVEPFYQGCHTFGKPSHVEVNECKYVFNAAGTMDIACNGKEITIKVTESKTNMTVICTIHVPSQTGLGGYHLHKCRGPSRQCDKRNYNGLQHKRYYIFSNRRYRHKQVQHTRQHK